MLLLLLLRVVFCCCFPFEMNGDGNCATFFFLPKEPLKKRKILKEKIGNISADVVLFSFSYST